MKVHLKYRGFLDYQPIWWINFVKGTLGNRIYSNDVRREMIADSLKSFGGVRIIDNDNREEYIKFEDDSKATWFLLRWS